jgi:hypothetical protein
VIDYPRRGAGSRLTAKSAKPTTNVSFQPPRVKSSHFLNVNSFYSILFPSDPANVLLIFVSVFVFVFTSYLIPLGPTGLTGGRRRVG